jgi:hypothetical protein
MLVINRRGDMYQLLLGAKLKPSNRKMSFYEDYGFRAFEAADPAIR